MFTWLIVWMNSIGLTSIDRRHPNQAAAVPFVGPRSDGRRNQRESRTIIYQDDFRFRERIACENSDHVATKLRYGGIHDVTTVVLLSSPYMGFSTIFLSIN